MNATGTVRGNAIVLDAPVPELEGRRVHVIVEPLPERAISSDENARLWSDWVAKGPQGPLEEGDDAWP